MADDRSLTEKLEAMATQTAASPREAEIARRILSKAQGGPSQTRGAGEIGQTPGRRGSRISLTRETILSAPDRAASVALSYKVEGRWITLDVDEIELVNDLTGLGPKTK